jgi:hypothetical protein
MSEHHGRKGARNAYKHPHQRYTDSIINVKLFCDKDGCNNYTRGKLGYNGNYTDEDGTLADLRNQVWFCSKHAEDL